MSVANGKFKTNVHRNLRLSKKSIDYLQSRKQFLSCRGPKILNIHLSIYVLSAVFHHSGAGFRDHANWRCLGLCVPRASAADNATGERELF